MNSKLLSTALALLFGSLISVPAARLSAAPALDTLIGSAGGNAVQDVPEPSAPAALPGPLRSVPALNAYFISVGQGDSEYIELPNGKNALIDGGPNPTASLSQFLSQHNVTHIDYVVLTHPHSDHFDGLVYVFDHLKVDNFYDTREENTGAVTIAKLRAKIPALGVNVVYPSPGESLDWDPGEVQVKVLNSCSTPGSSTDGGVLNDCSIVLRVTYQNTSILYTGDMQSDMEAKLVATYGSGLQSDVLKVGHHGSSTASSMAFLNAVKPKYAYIEVGAGNNFGFPAQSTLSNLQAVGATVYRTDTDGTQEYTIGGN
jgi:beta-lactamase superfamily II metal-dependent hydrolase